MHPEPDEGVGMENAKSVGSSRPIIRVVWVAVVAAAFLVASGTPGKAGSAAHEHAQAAARTVEKIANRTLKVLKNANLDTPSRQGCLERVLSENLDLKAIANFTLGHHRTTLSEAQRQTFEDEFGSYVIASYARRISRRAPESVDVIASRQVTPRTAAVSTRARKADGGSVVWTWRLLERDGRYRIVDLQMAGVSLAVTYRSKIGATLASEGFDSVISELRMHLEHGTAMRVEQIALFQLLGLNPGTIAERVALTNE
jgi:phospholipid transport system substrate-binding protein